MDILHHYILSIYINFKVFHMIHYPPMKIYDYLFKSISKTCINLIVAHIFIGIHPILVLDMSDDNYIRSCRNLTFTYYQQCICGLGIK